ncbi:protein-tyrosine-phosphatase [Actinoallomurus liliacearum]|uniref:protein-tyrosine-phosphatase n=1 Tax=Actinoallomurus liliacearum TaxID=1080073 RepID=A0ABP8TFH5_9ACTN
MTPERFHLLFVCTANICRSPIAAELTRLKIRTTGRSDGSRLAVSSAGTRGRDGAAMDPRAVALLRSLGGDTAGFSARAVTAAVAATADLVLTAERRHLEAVVACRPASHSRVFTILEFARLVDRLDAGRLTGTCVVSRAVSLVREAARTRGLTPPGAAGADDIPDPYQRSDGEYRACATAIDRALDRPLRYILSEPA